MDYECDLGEIAKDVLGSMTETPYNKEIIDSWREAAVTLNVNLLYNTPEEY